MRIEVTGRVGSRYGVHPVRGKPFDCMSDPNPEGPSLEKNIAEVRQRGLDMGQLLDALEKGLKQIRAIRERISEREDHHDSAT